MLENDESDWDDDTGVLYHFPKRYLHCLEPGTEVIYYKGGIQDKSYQNKRLSNAPHYFGTATIGKVFPDNSSKKKDYFATINDFEAFSNPILAKIDGKYLEDIPENHISNYWRNGVRPITSETYKRIMSHVPIHGLKTSHPDYDPKEFNDQIDMFESFYEGDKTKVFVTKYERNSKLRRQAIAIHGCCCAACGFDFGKIYGERGKGYIHIHHIVPVSQFGTSKAVDPETDLVPLCANCHAMVHRDKNKTLSIDELKLLLKSIS